jgi:hypothetical protein
VPEINSNHLLVLGTGRGLAYVLRERKMAFPPTRQVRLDVGDRLLLYTTRNVFRRSDRDRGRVVGTAEVASPILPLEEQLLIAERKYTSGCDLKITGLAMLGQGVLLADIAEKLMVFQPHPEAWRAWLRRAVLPLPPSDARFILTRLQPVLRDPNETVGAYLERAASSELVDDQR